MSVSNKSANKQRVALPFTRPLLSVKYWPTWLGLLLAALVGWLPQPARHRLGQWLGDYLYRKRAKRFHVSRANLRQVFPEASDKAIEARVKAHLQWYGKGLVDYSLFFFGGRERLFSSVSINGGEHLWQAVKQNQAVILLLTHSVMLEFAAVALASEGIHSFGSYKKSKNALLDWVIARSRCRFVDFVVSREEGLRPLIRAIQSRRVMIFLPDEDLGLDNSVFAPFFNRQKATLTTPSRLCKLGKATAIAGFVGFNERESRYELNLSPMPANYPSGNHEQDAADMNRVFESLIRQSPEQYMWLMKFYKTTHVDDTPIY
ncbi:MAG: lipid A biosynthesis acyltransferase [Proteobacteria bacterium]|nr:MAG: lipid A biosynthesis acyltransferase [Pseudomonadota bacterium]